MKPTRGFTLLELMITVAIIAILAAIAVPQYNEYVARSMIVEGTAGLADMRVRMEQFYQDNRNYTGAGCGTCGAACPNSQYFNFTCDSAGQTYTVTATATAGRIAGLVFTIDEQNVRQTTGVPAGWTAPAGNCWTLRKSGHC